MEKMYHSFVKDLRNFEFHELFTLLANRLDKENLEGSILQEPAERIKFQRNELILLKHAKPGHPLTKVINEKLRTRTEYLACLHMTINANLLTYLPEKRKAANRLKLWLDRYKKKLYIPTITIQSNLVRAMMDDREKLDEIKQAIALLDLDGLLDEIMKLTDEISNDALQRSKDTTHNSMVIKGLRDNAYNDLKTLIKAVELTYDLATDEEEKERIARLGFGISNRLKTTRTILRSRRTKSKNKGEALKKAIDKEQEQMKNNLPMVIYDGLQLGLDDFSLIKKSKRKGHSDELLTIGRN